MGPLPRTYAGNQLIVILTHKCAKLTKVKSSAKKTSTEVAKISFDDCINIYEIQNTVLSENDKKFIRKFFTSLSSYLGTVRLRTRNFHPHTNGEMERYNKAFASQLLLCIASIQQNWYIFVKPLTFAYYCQVHRINAKTHS